MAQIQEPTVNSFYLNPNLGWPGAPGRQEPASSETQKLIEKTDKRKTKGDQPKGQRHQVKEAEELLN